MTDHNPVCNIPIPQPPPDYDTATHSHRHLLLASAVEADRAGDAPCPVTLYRWTPPAIRALTPVAATLSPSALEVIKGCTALGMYFLPEEVDVAGMLSGLLAAEAAAATVEAEAAAPSGADPTPQLLGDLIAQVGVPERAGMLVRFFAFPVFTASPALEQEVLGEGRESSRCGSG